MHDGGELVMCGDSHGRDGDLHRLLNVPDELNGLRRS